MSDPPPDRRGVAPADLARALAHYERLGFAVQSHDNEDYYGCLQHAGHGCGK